MQPDNQNRSARWSAFRRLGIYGPLLVIFGFVLPVLAYLAFMRVLGWSIPAVSLGGFSALTSSSFSATSSQELTLYASPNTEAYFLRIGGQYSRLLAPWRDYSSNRHKGIKEISNPALLRELKGGVLILPSAVALSTDERRDIQRFLFQGGSLLATWATGSRNEGGTWEGWRFLDNFGVEATGEMPEDPATRYLILKGESPLAHSQAAGQRIWLGNASERLLRFRGKGIAAEFMPWSRLPDDDRKEEGAVLYSESAAESGRTALFAFSESAWASQPEPIYALVDDTLSWLLRQPAVVRATWPNGNHAAQVVAMDLDEAIPNATYFAKWMQKLSYRGDFFVQSSDADANSAILNTLATQFDVGYNGDVRIGFKGQPAPEQKTRIDAMQETLNAVLRPPTPHTGFKAPLDSHDGTTETLLQKAGIRYLVSDASRTDAQVPVLASLPGISSDETLVILPRTQRDDLHFSRETLDAAQTQQAMIQDFDLALRMGALGLLSLHSRNYTPDGALETAMNGYSTYLQDHRAGVWLASSRQVASWWKERDRFKLSSNNSGRRLNFNITVTGKEPVQGGGLIVMLPRKGITPAIQGLTIGMPTPTVTQIDNYRALISFNTLLPGNYAYRASFE